MYCSGRVDGGARLVDYVRIQDPIESVTPSHGMARGLMQICCWLEVQTRV